MRRKKNPYRFEKKESIVIMITLIVLLGIGISTGYMQEIGKMFIIK